MIKKLIIFLFFTYIFISLAGASDVLVNKILYKKTLINYNQPVLINIYLNPMNVKDVIIFFNNTEITDINKNLKPYIKEETNFLPSFNFEVKNVKNINFLQIFVVLSQGITVSSEAKLYFEKGIVIDNDNFQITKNKIFFIKVGDFYKDGILYNIDIDNTSIIKKIDEVISENILYYQLKSLNTGNTKLNIFKYDESLEKQENLPIKIIRITVKN